MAFFMPHLQINELIPTFNKMLNQNKIYGRTGNHSYEILQFIKYVFMLLRHSYFCAPFNEALSDVNTMLDGSTYHERWFVSLLYFSLLMQTEQAISETSAAFFKDMEPYYCSTAFCLNLHTKVVIFLRKIGSNAYPGARTCIKEILKKSSTQRESNPRQLDNELRALPPCHNCCRWPK